MDKFLKLILVFYLLFPFNVFAETYPAVDTVSCPNDSYITTTPPSGLTAGGCVSFWSAHPSSPSLSFSQSSYSGHAAIDVYNNGNLLQAHAVLMFAQGKTCPYGGTVSGSDCVNAPSCPTGQARNAAGECKLVCKPPETDDGFGSCAVMECTGGQVSNACTGQCQTPVVCSSTFETYDSCTNSCILNKLNCPIHSHPNSTNDACLPDPPLACPAGQHDDGTYNCIADDAPGCGSDEQRGTVDGKLVCKKKHDASKDEDKAKKAEEADAAAKADAQAKADAAKAAKDARDADPTNQEKIDAYNAAQAAADAAALAAAQAASDLANKNAKNLTGQVTELKETTKDILDTMTSAPDLPTDPDAPLATPVDIVTTGVTVGGAGSCPADQSISTSIGNFTISMQPLCTLASSLAPLFIAICFLISGFIVFGAVKG